MTARRTAVIGAGIIGSLVAHELVARAPQAGPVTVLDRDTTGAGASRRSAGLQLPRGGTERVREMSRTSGEFYRKLLENRPSLPIYPLPEASVVSARPPADALAAYLPEAEPTPLPALPNPDVRLSRDAGIWRIDGCHQADVYGVCLALARELRSRVSYREGVRVTSLQPSEDGVLIGLSTGDRLAVDQLVLAPGPWLHEPAWRELVAPLGIRVKKIVALHVEQVPAENARAIIFADEDAFLIPLVHRGHWLFSYTCPEWDVDPDRLLDGLSAGNLGQARQCLRRYSPSLAEDCGSGRVFCDAYSKNGEPQIARLDGAGRIVFAGAANGSGYRLAPAIAAEAVDLLQLPEVRSVG